MDSIGKNIIMFIIYLLLLLIKILFDWFNSIKRNQKLNEWVHYRNTRLNNDIFLLINQFI